MWLPDRGRGSEIGLVNALEILEMRILSEDLAGDPCLRGGNEDDVPRLEGEAAEDGRGCRGVATGGDVFLAQEIDHQRGLDLVGDITEADFGDFFYHFFHRLPPLAFCRGPCRRSFLTGSGTTAGVPVGPGGDSARVTPPGLTSGLSG